MLTYVEQYLKTHITESNSKTSKTTEKGTASITTRFRSVEDNRLYKGNNVTIILS